MHQGVSKDDDHKRVMTIKSQVSETSVNLDRLIVKSYDEPYILSYP